MTFAVLGVAMGTNEFSSAGNAVFNLLKQSLLGIALGGTLGYMASILIAHERYGFLSE